LDSEWQKGKVRSFPTFASFAHAAKAEVDVETVKAEVLEYSVADDSGNIINPMLIEGQLHSNVVAEIPSTLTEEIVYDYEGQLMTSTFVDYLKPTVKEQFLIRSEFLSTRSPFTLLGMKSVETGAVIPVIATIASAVEDALSQFGVVIDSKPITPKRMNAIVFCRKLYAFSRLPNNLIHDFEM
jgi:CO/xanthine dehydrogenase Mo-binding subunit